MEPDNLDFTGIPPEVVPSYISAAISLAVAMDQLSCAFTVDAEALEIVQHMAGKLQLQMPIVVRDYQNERDVWSIELSWGEQEAE